MCESSGRSCTTSKICSGLDPRIEDLHLIIALPVLVRYGIFTLSRTIPSLFHRRIFWPPAWLDMQSTSLAVWQCGIGDRICTTLRVNCMDVRAPDCEIFYMTQQRAPRLVVYVNHDTSERRVHFFIFHNSTLSIPLVHIRRCSSRRSLCDIVYFRRACCRWLQHKPRIQTEPHQSIERVRVVPKGAIFLDLEAGKQLPARSVGPWQRLLYLEPGFEILAGSTMVRELRKDAEPAVACCIVQRYDA